MIKKIIFYAPLGYNSKIQNVGGGEYGCRRTYEILKRTNFIVSHIDKPNTSMGKFKYIKMSALSLFKFIKEIIKGTQITYIVGFYDKNLYFELFLLILSKIRNISVIYEIRNGNFITLYMDRNCLYKSLVKFLINHSNIIFCQGEPYIEFLKQISKVESIYTPNYIMNKYFVKYQERSMDVLELIYFGRVSESKNIDIILSVYSEVKNRIKNSRLTIIGAYEINYRKKLDCHIELLNIDGVSFLGKLSFDEITNYLSKSHFFLFPSNEKKEGHSNSLTEAMAYGVVPIASNVGFNCSVIRDDRLIAKSFEVLDYSNIICSIWDSGDWEDYSKSMYKRVEENYTEDHVSEDIVNAIRNLEV